MTEEFRISISFFVLEMTRCLILGTLNIYFWFYERFYRMTEKQLKDLFGVDISVHLSTKLKKMPKIADTFWVQEFMSIAKKFKVRAPNIIRMANNFNYFPRMYFTYFQNNMCVLAYKQIRMFCSHQKQKVGKKAIHDTMHYLFYTTSEKIQDPGLLHQIRTQFRPIKLWNENGYIFGMESKWFKFVPMFMHSQW